MTCVAQLLQCLSWSAQQSVAKQCLKLTCTMQICDEVRNETPTDEQILSTMTMVYRRANRMQDMSAAYAAASAAHPRDELLLKGVFTSYARQDLRNANISIAHLGMGATNKLL